MSVAIVVVTHNRLAYTQRTFERLLSDDGNFNLYIWDNNSGAETIEYLKSLSDSRIQEVVFRNDNLGPTVALNHFWSRSKDQFLAKVDNDCIITPGWIETFCQAHQDIQELGAVACWHYREEDFDYNRAAWKIQQFGTHQIFRHPWVCGSGFIMKRETYERMGPWPEGSRSIGTTGYFLRMAKAGYVNGWYYPLILQDHQDDPLSPFCMFSDDESLKMLYESTYSLRENRIASMADRMKRRETVIDQLLTGPVEADYYLGWRAKLRRLKARLTS